MKTMLCYGDSNTWGCVPLSTWADNARYEAARRWPNVMQKALGEDWQGIAEGLLGRTPCMNPVEGGHMSGLAYLRPCLESHRPIDLVVLMLGTNDFKRRFSLDGEDVAQGLERLILETARRDVFGGEPPRILVVCPPPIDAVSLFMTMFATADLRSRQLAPLLRDVASAHGAGFLNAGDIIRSSPIDGIHLSEHAQVALGRAVAAAASAFLSTGDQNQPAPGLAASASNAARLPGSNEVRGRILTRCWRRRASLELALSEGGNARCRLPHVALLDRLGRHRLRSGRLCANRFPGAVSGHERRRRRRSTTRPGAACSASRP
jgi:lysophospholipase L1-like esterase